MKGIFLASLMLFGLIFAVGNFIGFPDPAYGTQPSVSDLPPTSAQATDSAAIAPEDVADEEDMQPECADGYLFFYGRQVWMTRDVPAVCGGLRKEFSDWLARRSPLINQGETLARSWNFFIGDKLRNEGK